MFNNSRRLQSFLKAVLPFNRPFKRSTVRYAMLYFHIPCPFSLLAYCTVVPTMAPSTLRRGFLPCGARDSRFWGIRSLSRPSPGSATHQTHEVPCWVLGGGGVGTELVTRKNNNFSSGEVLLISRSQMLTGLLENGDVRCAKTRCDVLSCVRLAFSLLPT
jgi:hypothetical protein